MPTPPLPTSPKVAVASLEDAPPRWLGGRSAPIG